MNDSLALQLAPFGQEHLLAFWDGLSESQRTRLAEQIRAIDFEQLAQLHRRGPGHEDWDAIAHRAEGPPAVRFDGQTSEPALSGVSRCDAQRRGGDVLRSGTVGVILVAGGQGSRLGFDQPKGMYPIGPVSGASLFQWLLEKVLATARRYRVHVPLYVMTSPATHAATIAFFEQHGQFGLPPEDVSVFCQGTMPAVDAETGRVLLAERGEIAVSPDGHGGLVAALARSAALADMRRRGIERLFYMQVDNPLVPVCDEAFLGYHAASGSEVSTLVVAKQSPDERLGNVVRVDGRMRIIEYSDLSPVAATRRSADGSPKLWAGNTAVHVFERSLLERAANSADALPFHVARKAVSYVDPSGRRIVPERPNAMKFERFIFDLLPLADRAIAVETDRESTFAPLKNSPGEANDSPETVRAQMIALYRQWLRDAGALVAEDAVVEISPRFARDAAEVRSKIAAGTRVTSGSRFC